MTCLADLVVRFERPLPREGSVVQPQRQEARSQAATHGVALLVLLASWSTWNVWAKRNPALGRASWLPRFHVEPS